MEVDTTVFETLSGRLVATEQVVTQVAVTLRDMSRIVHVQAELIDDVVGMLAWIASAKVALAMSGQQHEPRSGPKHGRHRYPFRLLAGGKR